MNARTTKPETPARDGDALWAAYRQRPCEETGMALIRHHLPLVRRVVRQMAIYQTPFIDMEDLMQYALMGLWTAMDRFDGQRGVPFEAFALPRIRGSIHDALRRQDPLTRTEREAMKELNRITQEYMQEYNQAPDEETLAELAGIDVEKMREMLVRAQPAISLDAEMGEGGDSVSTLAERLPDERAPDPHVEASRSEQRERFRRAFKKLPVRQQKILYLYYFEDLTLKEVGAAMDLTEARICQIHAAALMQLRAIMAADEAPAGRG